MNIPHHSIPMIQLTMKMIVTKVPRELKRCILNQDCDCGKLGRDIAPQPSKRKEDATKGGCHQRNRRGERKQSNKKICYPTSQYKRNSWKKRWTRMVDRIAMTQYGVNKGLKVFGKRGQNAVHKEVKQLHNMEVITPIHLTPKQRRAALQYLMFLKEKRSGAIKG